MKDERTAAVEAADVPNEKQMRESTAPRLESMEELSAYITSLVDRRHDYGTCVYAMSLAATATFNFVAGMLGVTGFQASCADMDILRQTRDFTWGRLVKYENLLYPQYCTSAYFPSVDDLLKDPEIRDKLREMAQAKLAQNHTAAGAVIEHWKRLAK